MDHLLDYGKVCVYFFKLSLFAINSNIILVRCDDTDIFTGKLKDPSTPQLTIGAAQKMRSAMTHKFGRDFGRGTQHWIENPMMPGKWLGNPSISVTVTQYMISLNRRKVCFS